MREENGRAKWRVDNGEKQMEGEVRTKIPE